MLPDSGAPARSRTQRPKGLRGRSPAVTFIVCA
jgi:hypothetical protein